MKMPFSAISDRLRREDVERILRENNAIVTRGHFVYSKPDGCGDHGPNYVAKNRLYTNPDVLADLCLEMAWKLRDLRVDYEADVIVGPQTGGISLCSLVGFFHSQIRRTRLAGPTNVRSAFVEKKPGGGFEFCREYDQVVAGRNVVIVEDVLNSGGSALETIRAVLEAGGNPVGVLAICNRGGVTAEMLSVRFVDSLISFKFDKYPEGLCPLCEEGIPVQTSLGHGREFLERMRQHP